MSTLKKICEFLSNRLIFIGYISAVIINYVFSYHIYLFMGMEDKYYHHYSMIANNWKYGPILDVVVTSNSDKSCPKNYEHLFTDYWLGTVNGKYFKNWNTTYRGNCPNVSPFCTQYEKINKVQLITWKNTTICAKRFKSYLDLNKTNIKEDNQYRNNKCAQKFNNTEMRSCGVLDDFDNELCLEKSIPCPFNYVEFFEENKQIPNNRILLNHSIIHLNSGGKFVFYREVPYIENQRKPRILANFEKGDNYPCGNTKIKALNHTPHLFENSLYRRCNRTDIDPKKEDYQYLDTEKYRELYEDNKILTAFNKLPNVNYTIKIGNENYTNYLNDYTNIYYRSYIGMTCNRQKRKGFLDKFTNYTLAYQTIESVNTLFSDRTLPYANLVFSTFGMFSVLVNIVIIIAMREPDQKIFIILGLLSFISYGGPLFITSSLTLYRNFGEGEKFVEFDDCFKNRNKNLTFAQDFTTMDGENYTVFILSVVIMVISLFPLYLLGLKHNKKRNFEDDMKFD